MNGRIKTASLLLAATILGSAVIAQDAKVKKIEKEQEIVIRKKGDKNEKTTIVIEGDKITVNGKPMEDLKGGDIRIMKIEKNGKGPLVHERRMGGMFSPRGMEREDDFKMMAPELAGNKALLGVTTEKEAGGVKITGVSDGSGAEKAGLKEGDVITKVGSNKIETPADLIEAVGKQKPNDQVEIAYMRDGKNNKTTATLGENKMHAFSLNMPQGNFNFKMPPSLDGAMFNWYKKPKIGLQIQDLEEGKGVKVKEVEDDSPAEKSGLKEDDIITDINGKTIEGVDALREQIRDLKEGDSLKFGIKRNGNTQVVDVKIPKKLKTADL